MFPPVGLFLIGSVTPPRIVVARLLNVMITVPDVGW
jgi:hypothetical protein